MYMYVYMYVYIFTIMRVRYFFHTCKPSLDKRNDDAADADDADDDDAGGICCGNDRRVCGRSTCGGAKWAKKVGTTAWER